MDDPLWQNRQKILVKMVSVAMQNDFSTQV